MHNCDLCAAKPVPLRYLPLRRSGQRSRQLNYGVQERQQVPNVSSGAPHYHHYTQLGLIGSPGSIPRRNLQLGGAGRLREHSLPIMVYDWDGKREICYQMYIKDKKALEEIMEYMKTAYQFAPR